MTKDDVCDALAAARAAWQHALDILDHLGHILIPGPGSGYPDAGQIRAKLRQPGRPAQTHSPGGGGA